MRPFLPYTDDDVTAQTVLVSLFTRLILCHNTQSSSNSYVQTPDPYPLYLQASSALFHTISICLNKRLLISFLSPSLLAFNSLLASQFSCFSLFSFFRHKIQYRVKQRRVSFMSFFFHFLLWFLFLFSLLINLLDFTVI